MSFGLNFEDEGATNDMNPLLETQTLMICKEINWLIGMAILILMSLIKNLLCN